jgi:hypothetical protein
MVDIPPTRQFLQVTVIALMVFVGGRRKSKSKLKKKPVFADEQLSGGKPAA